MNRRELLMKAPGTVAAPPVLGATQGAPREVCPVCRADQTGKAWYAGVQNVGGYCQAVCWDCRERVVTYPSSKA